MRKEINESNNPQELECILAQELNQNFSPLLVEKPVKNPYVAHENVQEAQEVVYKSEDKPYSFFGSFFPIYNDNSLRIAIFLSFAIQTTAITHLTRKYDQRIE